jgi:hypothetical protein
MSERAEVACQEKHVRIFVAVFSLGNVRLGGARRTARATHPPSHTALSDTQRRRAYLGSPFLAASTADAMHKASQGAGHRRTVRYLRHHGTVVVTAESSTAGRIAPHRPQRLARARYWNARSSCTPPRRSGVASACRRGARTGQPRPRSRGARGVAWRTGPRWRVAGNFEHRHGGRFRPPNRSRHPVPRMGVLRRARVRGYTETRIFKGERQARSQPHPGGQRGHALDPVVYGYASQAPTTNATIDHDHGERP